MVAFWRALSVFCALLLTAGPAFAAFDCSGDIPGASLPYSISATKSGDASSTTFIMILCSTGCSDPSDKTCQPLSSASFGTADLTIPEGETDACGAKAPEALLGSLALSSPNEQNCVFVYLEGSEPDMTLASSCPNGCQVQLQLENGERGVITVEGDGPTPEPSPSPVPVSTPPPPHVYGGRRRSLASLSHMFESRRELNQYGGRRLNQYGERRRNQYGGRRLNQYGSA